MKTSLSRREIHAALHRLADRQPLWVTVRGECMMPLITDNARVQVTPATFYWPGDVVVVLSASDQYLIHRVIGMYRRSGTFRILTWGDNGASPDTGVPPDAVLGKVSGGSCHPHAVRVPVLHRLGAAIRFLRFLLSWSVKKFFPGG